ncbi:MAG: hypothetical protein C0404_10555 [Verrucomicrobia bacterium]|nr:hypothetical protein [Verrucomicrobiota bacterium]
MIMRRVMVFVTAAMLVLGMRVAAEDPFVVPMPVIDVTATNVFVGAVVSDYPTSVKFDATGSIGYNSPTITSYAWDFGDGKTASGMIVTNNYTSMGAYFAMLTVSDSGGGVRRTYTQVFILTNAPGGTVTITASAGAGGTISPNGAVSFAKGSSPTFTIAANSGYQIADVKVDNVSQGAVSSYPFTNVQTNHTISATFAAVVVKPSITAQPANQSVAVGQAATFSVTATGTAPISYQWRKSSTNISGATASSYTTPAATSSDNGAQFTVVVANSAGSATSGVATLTVTVTATNALIANWKLDETGGTAVSDATGRGYTGTLQNGAAWTSAGKVGGALQLTNSSAMFLCSSKVVPLGAAWTIGGWFTAPLPNTGVWHTFTRSQVNDHHIIADSSLNLGMYDNATSGQFRGCGYNLGALSAGWHHVAAVGSGTTTAFYVDGAYVGKSDRKAASSDVYAVGNYQGGNQRFSDKIDEVRVYNYALSAADISAWVGAVSNQIPTVAITSPTNGAAFTAPAVIAIAANASDPDGSVTKVEFFNGATKLGEDLASPYGWTWTNGVAGSYAVTARATDNQGAAKTSTVVNVTVNPAPVKPAITTQPANRSVTAGQAATFSVAATGTAPLSYQWRKNAANVSGATATTYTTPATTTNDNGSQFSVVVANSAGSVTSGVATLTVTTTNKGPTVATAASASPNPATGSTAALGVLGADDGGETALTYSWAATGTPPAPVAFSANSNNAAKNCTATFTKSGSYSLQVTIRDAAGLSVASSVGVTVNQTLTSIVVTPASASIYTGTTQQFSASARDQFGTALTAQPSFAWTAAGGGTISSSGLFTAGSTNGGPFTVTASSGGKSGTASVTVVKRPAVTATLSVYDAKAAEASDAGQFRISLNQAPGTALTVKYAMSGTASNGSDYNLLSGSVSIPATGTVTYVAVTPKDDTLVEGTETVTMTLQTNAAYATGTSSGSVTLYDDEKPEVTLVTSDSVAAEAAGDAGKFTVTRYPVSTNGVVVKYTMTGTASNGLDYTALSGSATIPGGAATLEISVFPLSDTLAEGPETAVLTLSTNGVYMRGSAYSGTVTIHDEDKPTVSISAYDNYVSETATNIGILRATVNPLVARALTLYYAMSGTSSNGVDYQTMPGTVTIPANTGMVSLVLTPVNDTVVEATEGITMTLLANAAYSVGTAAASATLYDNDEKPAEIPSGVVQGLKYQYYHGAWSVLPDFGTLTPVASGSVSNFTLNPRTTNDNFGFRFTGYVQVPTNGTYTFYTSSDDGSRLWVGSLLIVDNDGLHGATEKSGVIGLKAGKHAIRVDHFERTGSEALSVSYAGPGITKQVVPATVLWRVGP